MLLIFNFWVLFFSIIKNTQQSKKINALVTNLENQNKMIANLKSEVGLYKTESFLHPIEQEIQECMKKGNYTTATMNNCVYNSFDSWDKDISNSLQTLKKTLPPEQYELIEQSQKKWNDYKLAQWKVFNSIYDTKVGTIYTNILAGSKSGILANRAKILEALVNDSIK